MEHGGLRAAAATAGGFESRGCPRGAQNPGMMTPHLGSLAASHPGPLSLADFRARWEDGGGIGEAPLYKYIFYTDFYIERGASGGESKKRPQQSWRLIGGPLQPGHHQTPPGGDDLCDLIPSASLDSRGAEQHAPRSTSRSQHLYNV